MKKLPILGALALSVILLSGCTQIATGSPGEGILVPSTAGDNVEITEMSGDEVNTLIENGGASIDEFDPTLDGDTITFFTNGSSSCKNTPIAAKAGNDGTRVAFKIYPQDTTCTADFGIYGWKIKFLDNPPFEGVPFLHCEGDVCYNDLDGSVQDW